MHGFHDKVGRMQLALLWIHVLQVDYGNMAEVCISFTALQYDIVRIVCSTLAHEFNWVLIHFIFKNIETLSEERNGVAPVLKVQFFFI